MIDAAPLPGLPALPGDHGRGHRAGLTPAEWVELCAAPNVRARFDALRWQPAAQLRGATAPTDPTHPPAPRSDPAQPPPAPRAAHDAALTGTRQLRDAAAPRADATPAQQCAEFARADLPGETPEFPGSSDLAVTRSFSDPFSDDPDDWCIPWLGAVSSTGHGSFRIVSARRSGGRGVVPAHLFAWVLERGPVDRDGPAAAGVQVELLHSCDEYGCTNLRHLRLDRQAVNRREAIARRRGGPLADLRGPAGRTRAIAKAVREGIELGETVEQIHARQLAAASAGEPARLF